MMPLTGIGNDNDWFDGATGNDTLRAEQEPTPSMVDPTLDIINE